MISGWYDVGNLCSELGVLAVREDAGEHLRRIDKYSPSARAAEERRWKPRLSSRIADPMANAGLSQQIHVSVDSESVNVEPQIAILEGIRVLQPA